MNKWLVMLFCFGMSACGVFQPQNQQKSSVAPNANVYLQLGLKSMGEKQYKVALGQFQRAIEVEPSNSQAYGMLGYLYQTIKEHDKAEDAYQKALELDGNNASVLNNYGRYACSRSEYAKAEGLFRQSYTNPLYKPKWVPLTNAGLCALSNQKGREAEVHFRQALQLNPGYSPALLEMSDIQLDNQNYRGARAYLQRYAEVAAHTSRSLWIGIRTERILGDKNANASYSLNLRNNFPTTKEAELLLKNKYNKR